MILPRNLSALDDIVPSMQSTTTPGSPEASPLIPRPPEQTWRKLGQVLGTTETEVWDRTPASPHVFEWEGRLRMYYEGRSPYIQPSGRREYILRIGFAEASLDNPMVWTKHSANPVLDVGPTGSVDSHWAGYPWIVRITDAHWHMYYACFDGGSFLPNLSGGAMFRRWGTTMAESDDAGLTWRRAGKLLLIAGRPGACDEHGTGSCSVLKVGDEYWMWYTAIYKPRVDFRRISIALAVSRDGGHTFAPHPVGAVLNIPPELDANGTTSSKPHVEYRDGRFLMWYSCTTRDGRWYRIHYAESPDGICFFWHRDPVLDVSPGGWESKSVCYPSVVHLPGRTLMYYSGNGLNPSEQLDGIGVAQLARTPDPSSRGTR